MPCQDGAGIEALRQEISVRDGSLGSRPESVTAIGPRHAKIQWARLRRLRELAVPEWKRTLDAGAQRARSQSTELEFMEFSESLQFMRRMSGDDANRKHS